MKLKQKIIYFAILFLTASFSAKAAFEGAPSRDGQPDLPVAGYFQQAMDIINILFIVVFVASIIGFILSGIRYLVAGGDQGNLDAAGWLWKNSLIGLFVSLAGYVIIKLITFIT
ncbi:MAG: hypothetical protein U5L10_05430 [Candidatus Moranbacteria bacterium]|nr:hypothetical protein [Candidatus Moranbacteria bacterium]